MPFEASILERRNMKQLSTLALPTAITMLIAAFVLTSATARTGNADDFNAAAAYKGKCVACHGAAAEKKFDSSLADADLVHVVLKGKKPEKPPNMPGYEEKGITEDQAKALVAYMKSIKK